jgi:hypothetical protein
MGSIQMVSAMRKFVNSTTKCWLQLQHASAIKLAFILAMMLSVNVGRGQVTLLSENFGTTNAVLPTGWISSNTTNGWNGSTASASGVYTGASGGANAVFNGTGTNGVTHTLTYSNNLSTVGYNSITILWGGRGTSAFNGAITFQWSPDGTTWNNIAYTYTINGNAWALVNSGNAISLPAGAAGISNLRFRWSAASTNSGNYRIDDIIVKGTAVSSATLNPVTLPSPLSTTYGTASAGVSFTASGTNLTGDITATAQIGYQVSTDDINYSGSVSVASGLPVYVRFAATQNAGNYNGSTAVILSSTGATNVNVTTSVTGNTVSPKALSITAPTITSKVYDATTTAGAVTVGSLSGFVGTQTVTATATAAAYSSANVGTYNNVAVTYTLANGTNGGLAANYSLAAGTATGVITARALTITANDVTKAPGVLLTDGVVSSGFTSSGLAGAETVGTVTITYGSAGAATGDGNTIGIYANQVTPSAVTGGTFNPANYTITYVAGSINVSLYAIGDYRTLNSGIWNDFNIWQKWNGSAWANCLSGDVPNSPTASVTILNGHTVDTDGAGTGPDGPWSLKNLTVETGGKVWDNYLSLTGPTFFNTYLQVYGNIVCNGTIGSPTGDDISFDIAGGNTCTITGTGSFTAARLRKDDDPTTNSLNTTVIIDMNINLTWSSASGTVLFNNAGAASDFNVIVNAEKTIRCFGPGAVACNVSIDGTKGNGGPNLGGTYTIFGTMDIDGALYSLNDNTAVSTRSTSVIVKNNGTLKCRYIETGTSGAGNTLRVESGGRLNIFGSVDTVGSANQTTWNNFSTTNNTWDFQPGSTLEYSGNTLQSVNGITQCSNFTVSGGGAKTLSNPFTVGGILTLTNGRLNTTSTNILTLTSTATCPAGGSFSSFVNGPMRKEGSADFRFPVGKPAVNRTNLAGTGSVMNGGYRPISITGLTAPAAFKAEYWLENPYLRGSINPLAVGLQGISRCEYWDLERESGTQTPTVTLTWSDNSVQGQSQCNVGPYIISPSSTFVVPYYNGMWGDQNSTYYGRSGTITTPTSPLFLGEISWDGTAGAIDSYLKFVIGTNNWQQAPLPFDIKNFKATGKGKIVQLDWLINHNDEVRSYVIERSRDGIHFENMKMVAARANEDLAAYADIDPAPYNGWGYYRLRITDLAGKIGYSAVQKVWMGNTGTYVQVTPKPAKDRLWINLAEPEKISEMVIVNSVGQLLFKQNRFTNNNQIDISSFRPGVYYVRIVGQNGIVTEPFVKE